MFLNILGVLKSLGVWRGNFLKVNNFFILIFYRIFDTIFEFLVLLLIPTLYIIIHFKGFLRKINVLFEKLVFVSRQNFHPL